MRFRLFSLALGFASVAGLVHCDSSSPSAAPLDAGAPSFSNPDASSSGGDAAPANECAPVTGPGTKHGGDAVTAPVVWKAADGPHHVTFGFTVEAAATLTVEPCTEVVFDGGYGITVRGKLVAEGTPTKRISFAAGDTAKPWSGLFVDQAKGGTISLANATLSDGGNTDDPNITAMIDARGASDGPPSEAVKVRNVTIERSRSYGVVLRGGAGFTADSSDLVVTGSKLFPIRADARLTTNIPAGTYSGNATDEILLDLGATVDADTTLRARGVPYRLGGKDVNAGTVMAVGVSGPTPKTATVTIEAGVTIRASATSSLVMKKDASQNAVGRLVVKGTAASPVVFTSAAASPKAGDWQGIVFDAPDPSNVIDHARVEYAGGPSYANSFHCDPQSTTGGFSKNEDAAIALFGRPASAFVTNTTITASAGDGIGRSWSGDLLDLLPTNTFDQIAACKQSYPRMTGGSCPTGTIPCP